MKSHYKIFLTYQNFLAAEFGKYNIFSLWIELLKILCTFATTSSGHHSMVRNNRRVC